MGASQEIRVLSQKLVYRELYGATMLVVERLCGAVSVETNDLVVHGLLVAARLHRVPVVHRPLLPRLVECRCSEQLRDIVKAFGDVSNHLIKLIPINCSSME